EEACGGLHCLGLDDNVAAESVHGVGDAVLALSYQPCRHDWETTRRFSPPNPPTALGRRHRSRSAQPWAGYESERGPRASWCKQRGSGACGALFLAERTT